MRALRGFTLVELLVVITIIVILAGAGFSAGNSAIQKAKKTTCLAAATAIESAVNNFYTEYGSMPSDESTDTVFVTNATPGVNLLKALLGLEPSTASPMYNPRKLKFLSAKQSKSKPRDEVKRDGIVYENDGVTPEGMYDPWGGPFNIIMDLDYDERISVKTKAETTTATLNGRRVAVWSDGADGISATGKRTDDVKTWGQ